MQLKSRKGKTSRGRRNKSSKSKTTIHPFRAGFINIGGGWNTKSGEAVQVAQELQLDLLEVVETFQVTNSEDQLGEYTWLGRARKGKKAHGGVGFLAKTSLDPYLICHQNSDHQADITNEFQWLGINPPNSLGKVAIGICYLSPGNRRPSWNQEILEQMQVMKSTLELDGYKTMIMGDFNADIIDNGKQPPIKAKNTQLLQSFLSDNNMTSIHTLDTCKGRYTRMQGKHKSTLDYILVNNQDLSTVSQAIIDR